MGLCRVKCVSFQRLGVCILCVQSMMCVRENIGEHAQHEQTSAVADASMSVLREMTSPSSFHIVLRISTHSARSLITSTAKLTTALSWLPRNRTSPVDGRNCAGEVVRRKPSKSGERNLHVVDG